MGPFAQPRGVSAPNPSGSSRRFRVDSFDTGEDGLLDPGAGVHRHLEVLRLGAGEVIHLFDGRGTEMRAELVSIDGSAARLRLLETIERTVESPLETCLVQALPVRGVRIETIVRQSTELGVGRIVPVRARHSPQGKARPSAVRRKAERWQRIATSAAEQCGRTCVPRVEEPVGFGDLPWESLPRPLFIANPTADREGWSRDRDAARVADDTEGAGASVMVGPEGGWTSEELESARRRGAVELWLGPRVLRSDSAGVVALTLLQYLRGDLR